MTYYINGNKVGEEYAKARFFAFNERVNGLERQEIAAMWAQCNSADGEAARDEWMPDNLEIVV
jgi:hypothetical protein